MRNAPVLARSFFVPAIAFAIAAACCSTAAADSTVGGGFGRLDFRGDDSPHTIKVWDSDFDVSDREWEIDPRMVQNARSQVGAWLELALNARGFDQDPGLVDNDQAFDEAKLAIATTISLYRVPAEVRELLEALEAQVETANGLVRDLKVHYEAVEGQLKTLGRVGQGANPNEIQAARRAIGERLLADTGPLNAAREQLRLIMNQTLAALEQAADTLPPSVKKRVRLGVGEIISRLAGISEAGMATVGAIGRILGVGVTALAVGLEVIEELFSKDAVIIADETGSPLHADYPCRSLVRKFERTPVPNAVSCPAIGLPVEISLPLFGEFGRYTALNIVGGSQADNVELKIDNAAGEFSEIWVWGHGGNDTISGSKIGDKLIGGPGNDTIFGRSGDDRLFGDGSGFGAGGINPASARDTLLGGAGNDGISGEEGDDLILGGSNSDTAFIGAALSGGPGNDVIAGGPGNDEMRGGPGIDSVLAKESDFQQATDVPTKQTDVYDSIVDCGYGTTGPEYVTRSTVTDSGGNLETDRDCGRVITSTIPSIPTLIATQKKGGRWPWIG